MIPRTEPTAAPERRKDMKCNAARIIGAVVAVAILATGCGSAGGAPSLTPGTEAELSAEALAIGCSECALRQELFIRDQLFTWDTLAGDEEPMSQQIHDAIATEFPNATFVSSDETDALFVDGIVINDGVIVSVGPIEKLASDVIGVPFGVLFARLDGFAGVVQFKWSGDSWEYATSEDTGVTVTTAVS